MLVTTTPMVVVMSVRVGSVPSAGTVAVAVAVPMSMGVRVCVMVMSMGVSVSVRMAASPSSSGTLRSTSASVPRPSAHSIERVAPELRLLSNANGSTLHRRAERGPVQVPER